jgi:rRNA maturation endonuclease Nob1
MDRFQQAKEIATGATNLIKLKLHIADKDVEEIHSKRMNVCRQCSAYNKELNKCEICGCLLAIKTRSMESSCVSGHWKEVKK